MSDQCPFCQIISGKTPCFKIYEDNDVIAVLDINPASKGHTLVIPRQHFDNIIEVPDDVISSIFKVAKKLCGRIVGVVGAEGLNIVYGMGAVAGQRIAHFYVHIIPRSKGDEKSVVVAWQGAQMSQEDFLNLHKSLVLEVQKEVVVQKDEPARVVEEAKPEVVPEPKGKWGGRRIP